MSYMLDTSACINLLRGVQPPAEIEGQACCISAVVESELWAGVHHAGGKREKKKVQILLDAVKVLPFESEAAQATGQLLAYLTGKGIQIGDFDTQIAAHARCTDSTLVTANAKHFKRVPDLKLFIW